MNADWTWTQKTPIQSVSVPRYLHQVLVQIQKYYIDTPVALLSIILIVKIIIIIILMMLIMSMIVILLMINNCWDIQVYRRPSGGGAHHHSLALQFPSFVQVLPFLQSNDSYNCVTRAPLLYFIRSWVALSFKVVSESVSQWVRHR